MDDRTLQFLDEHIFVGLRDLNTGFDILQTRYFSREDFAIVLQRCAQFRIRVLGIEPWPDGEYGGVRVYENYGKAADDPTWYQQAFAEFLAEGVESHFAATYSLPASFSEIASEDKKCD